MGILHIRYLVIKTSLAVARLYGSGDKYEFHIIAAHLPKNSKVLWNKQNCEIYKSYMGYTAVLLYVGNPLFKIEFSVLILLLL